MFQKTWNWDLSLFYTLVMKSSQELFQAFFTTVIRWQKLNPPSFIFLITHSIAIVEVLFLIHHPLENHFTERYIFSVFTLEVRLPAV